MAKQVLIIGLGRFGVSLARSLTERGVEVLAVDANAARVQAAAAFVAEALYFDATAEEALARTSPGRRDVAICAIGDESREASIMCTALLRQMGAPRVIARANDELHARILRLVGAHHVVNPVREFAERFASRLVYERVMGELPLGEDLLITELRPPGSFVGRTLAELQLPRRHGITVVALRQEGRGTPLLPNPNQRLKEDDVLIVISHEDAVAKLLEHS